MSCGVGCRRGSDPALLWLWCRAPAITLIEPLAWEPQYAMGVALKRQKKRRKKKKPPKQLPKGKPWAGGGINWRLGVAYTHYCTQNQ